MLERALDDPAAARHPGVLHMYIHLMEMSPFPERGLPRRRPAARRSCPTPAICAHADAPRRALRRLPRVVECEPAARSSPTRSSSSATGAMNFYTLYRSHNHHFKIYGAMFLGQSQAALARRRPRGRAPRGAAADRAAADGRLAGGLPPHAAARADPLRQWQDILALPLPERPGAVLRHDGDAPLRPRASPTPPPGASPRPRRSATRSAPRSPGSRSRATFQQHLPATSSPSPAAMLDGELEYRKGNYDAAFAAPAPRDRAGRHPALRRAVGLDAADAPRLRRAAARAGPRRGGRSGLPRRPRPRRRSRAVRHPGQRLGLHGYHECLVRLGKPGRRGSSSSASTRRRPRRLPIRASCFCRMTHHAVVA